MNRRQNTDPTPTVGNPERADASSRLLDAIADLPLPRLARCPTPGCIGVCDYGRDTCPRCRERAEDRARAAAERESARVYAPRSGFARYSRGVGR